MQAIQTMVQTQPFNRLGFLSIRLKGNPLGKAGWPCTAPLPKVAMLIHHIKPEQVAQLERMFAKKTKSGVEIPSWLQELRKTPIGPAVQAKDLETTRPPAAVAEQHEKDVANGFESISLQRPAHSLVRVLRGGQT